VGAPGFTRNFRLSTEAKPGALKDRLYSPTVSTRSWEKVAAPSLSTTVVVPDSGVPVPPTSEAVISPAASLLELPKAS
jgi:hypothetical protein